MRSTVFLVLFLLVNSIAIKAQSVSPFILEDSEGNEQSYQQLKGDSLTVIDFWASWCKSCLSAIPKLNALSATYQNRGVRFIGISTDGPRSVAKVRPLVESLSISYPILLDLNNDVMRNFNVNAMPTIVIIKNNKIVFTSEGYVAGDENEIALKIEAFLKSK